MEYRVRLFANLRELAGEREIRVRSEGEMSLWDLISRLSESHEALGEELIKGGELNDDYLIVVNGRCIEPAKAREVRLKAGSEISIFPPVEGGKKEGDQ